MKENRRINLKLNLSHYNGGGANTYKAVEYNLRKEKLVLVVVDSDKPLPTSEVGETLSQINRVYVNFQEKSVVDVYALEVREKENLIPPSLFLLCSNGSCRDILKKLYEIELIEKHREKLKYIDIKDGVRAKDLKNTEQFKFLEELLVDVPDLIACSLQDINEQNDDAILIRGIGKKLEEFEHEILEDGLEKKLEEKRKLKDIPEIENAISQLEKNIEMKTNLFTILPDYVKPEWERLCKKIVSWGCCNPIISGVS